MNDSFHKTQGTTEVVATQRPDPTGWRAWHDFVQSAKATPDAPALRVHGKSLSYGQLLAKVHQIAHAIEAQQTTATTPVTAIYADRTVTAYAGVLAALMMGHAYVPLNPKFPKDRNQIILRQSGASCVVSSTHARSDVADIASGLDVAILGDGGPSHQGQPTALHDNPRAYILFTSGSTGIPKGVPISHANLSAYLDAASSVTDFRATDRFSQNFDLTFDLSVHDMFLCWRHGAELVVPSEKDLEDPAQYVLRDGVTCWFSVPSLAQKMRLKGALGAGALPQIRLSLFCGEALPLDLAQDWQAATGQPVENWYGPTEATIACMRYVLPAGAAAPQTHANLTPIGSCLPGMAFTVLDPDLNPVPVGEIGELYVTGPQLSEGYLNDLEKTAAAFVTLPGRPGIHYRTGDRVRLALADECHFIDRTDNQIKIRGYRVEIGEIEAVLRDLSGGCTAVVTPLPLKSPTPTALVATIEGWSGDAKALLARARAALPAYMVPTAIHQMGSFPKNASGKVDRGQIGQMVVAKTAEPAQDPNGEIARKLVAMVQKINPALTRPAMAEATDLMAAGLDSIGFTELTLAMEQEFALALDQTLVAKLSEMPFRRMVNFLRQRSAPISTNVTAPKAQPAEAPAIGPKLIAIARGINPALTRQQIQTASDLMAAGLDSIGFTEFTLAVEKQFGIELDQLKVARMSEMPLARLITFVRNQMGGAVAAAPRKAPAKAKPTIQGLPKPKPFHVKSVRTIEFIQRFPDFVQNAPHPLALFIGSSGTAFGVDAKTVEAHAAALGHPVTAANLGMAKLSNAGTIELLEFTRDVIAKAGAKVAFLVYELEIMQLSRLPAGGDIEVVKDYLANPAAMALPAATGPYQMWDALNGGTLSAPATKSVELDEQGAAPNEGEWQMRRRLEIREAYQGNVLFSPLQTDIWLTGAAFAKQITPNAMTFVHPLVRFKTDRAAEAKPSNYFGEQLRTVQRISGLPLLRHDEFRIADADFTDTNHVNFGNGRRQMSVDLTEAALAMLNAPKVA